MDPFGGFGMDPLSLHKYTYANADPVNGFDPSGYYTLTSVSLASRGIRPIVHRRGSSHDRGWLSTRLTAGACGPGLSGAGTGNDCDEFPMAIQTEGGRANYLAGRVSVKAASLNQNRSVGALVRIFHNACGIKVDDSSPEGAYVFGVTDAPTHAICGTNR